MIAPRVVSLFSGIGGFDLGFEGAGFSVSFQCEVDPFCVNILAKHWPEVRREQDIQQLSASSIPDAEVWAGGFPCQDVSLARATHGKGKGLQGKQSGLFFEFARLLGEKRPRVVVVENVPGLLGSNEGRDFAKVIGTMADLGYSVGWRTFNSRYFGVPQTRSRVFIVGCDRDGGGPESILFEPEGSTGNPSSHQEGSPTPVSAPGEGVGGIGDEDRGDWPVTPALSYCLCATSARHTGTDWSRTYVSYPRSGRCRRLMPVECEAIMGFPRNWTLPEVEWPNLDSARYHALGNAVTPPVATFLAGRILRYLGRTSSVGAKEGDHWMFDSGGRNCSTLETSTDATH